MAESAAQPTDPSVPQTAIERKIEALNRGLRGVPRPPRMSTVNGAGWTICGQFKDPDLGSKFFGFYGYQFTGGMQITVRTVYLVSHPVTDGRTDTNAYLFHGEISKDDFERIYPSEIGRLRRQSILTDTCGSVGCVFPTQVGANHRGERCGNLIRSRPRSSSACWWRRPPWRSKRPSRTLPNTTPTSPR
jgi:hypothetical protein